MSNKIQLRAGLLFLLIGFTATNANAQSSASAEAICNNGRWEVTVTGNCVEQYVDCVGTIPPQPATGENTLIRNYSRCDPAKEACFWDVKDGTDPSKPELKKNDEANKTDTMFSILPGAGSDGFIERNRNHEGKAIGWNNVKVEREKLVWVQRKGKVGDEPLRMMIPTKENDYQQFLKSAEKDGVIATDAACMPIEIRLCQGVKATAPRPCPTP